MILDRQHKFPHEIAIVSISKNEGPYVLEWIEFHRLVGVTKFYFYDNESEDNTYDLLKPYIDKGIVEYTLIKGKGKQLKAYNDAIKRFKNEARYMAFIDMDEYLVPSNSNNSINEIVDEIIHSAKLGAAGVGVNWAIYGNSGLEERSINSLITESFTHRAENDYYLNLHVKVICNPRMVKNYISPHYPIYFLGGYSVKEAYGTRITGWGANNIIYKNLRINHYYTKSKAEYLKKVSRGFGDRVGTYDMTQYDNYNKNDIFDDSMLLYTKELKNRLNNYPDIFK